MAAFRGTEVAILHRNVLMLNWSTHCSVFFQLIGWVAIWGPTRFVSEGMWKCRRSTSLRTQKDWIIRDMGLMQENIVLINTLEYCMLSSVGTETFARFWKNSMFFFCQIPKGVVWWSWFCKLEWDSWVNSRRTPWWDSWLYCWMFWIQISKFRRYKPTQI